MKVRQTINVPHHCLLWSESAIKHSEVAPARLRFNEVEQSMRAEKHETNAQSVDFQYCGVSGFATVSLRSRSLVRGDQIYFRSEVEAAEFRRAAMSLGYTFA